MPNHCYQQVYLRGPSHLIHHLHMALSKSEPEFCSTIAPMPFELWAKETQPDQVMPDWYEWRSRTGARSGMSARLRSTKMVLSIRDDNMTGPSCVVLVPLLDCLGSACSCVGSSSCDGH